MKFKTLLDNSGLQKGSQEAKQALKDLSKTGQESLSSLGDIFGVNTGKVQQMTSAIAGLGLKLEQTGEGGKAAFGKILQSMSGVAGAIAGISISGLVAAFKQLNSEAERFMSTTKGDDIATGLNAYVNTYKQALSDQNGAGAFFANAKAGWQKWKARTFTGLFMYNDEERANAKKTAEEAEKTAKRIDDIQDGMSDRAREWADWEAQIAEYQRIVADKTGDAAERQQAAAAATELINRLYGERIAAEKEVSELMDYQNSLASSTQAEVDAANQQAIKVSNLERERTQQLRSMDKLQRTIGSSMSSQASEAKKIADEAARMRKEMESAAISAGSVISGPMASMMGAASGMRGAPAMMNGARQFIEQNAGIDQYSQYNALGYQLHIGFDYDKNELIDITNDIKSTVADAAMSVGTIIGDLVGDLATGGDAWGNFANSAMTAFADMAIAVGKIAISTGAARIAIDAALSSGQAYAAIAAGVALVALGTAVKSGLGNIAAGNYSASSNVASSGYSSSSAGAFERQMEVRVTGTLFANGSQLIAVLNNENNRISTTS